MHSNCKTTTVSIPTVTGPMLVFLKMELGFPPSPRDIRMLKNICIQMHFPMEEGSQQDPAKESGQPWDWQSRSGLEV